jgi:hypothetical protein
MFFSSTIQVMKKSFLGRRGSSMVLVLMGAGILAVAVSGVSRLISDQVKNRNNYIIHLSAADVAAQIGNILIEPESCAATLNAANVSIVGAHQGTTILDKNSVPQFVATQDAFGIGKAKLTFNGFHTNNYDVANSTIKLFIRFTKPGEALGGNDLLIPMRLKITELDGDLIKDCYNFSVAFLEDLAKITCEELGGNVPTDICEELQVNWQNDSIEKACVEAGGEFVAGACEHPNKDDPCVGIGAGTHCFIVGYDPDGELLGCAPNCNCGSSIFPPDTCIDSNCGVTCEAVGVPPTSTPSGGVTSSSSSSSSGTADGSVSGTGDPDGTEPDGTEPDIEANEGSEGLPIDDDINIGTELETEAPEPPEAPEAPEAPEPEAPEPPEAPEAPEAPEGSGEGKVDADPLVDPASEDLPTVSGQGSEDLGGGTEGRESGGTEGRESGGTEGSEGLPINNNLNNITEPETNEGLEIINTDPDSGPGDEVVLKVEKVKLQKDQKDQKDRKDRKDRKDYK